MIKAGSRLPDGTLHELTVEYTRGCPAGPEALRISDLVKGKRGEDPESRKAGPVRGELGGQAAGPAVKQPRVVMNFEGQPALEGKYGWAANVSSISCPRPDCG